MTDSNDTPSAGIASEPSHFALLMASYIKHSTFEPIKGKPHPFLEMSHEQITRLVQNSINEEVAKLRLTPDRPKGGGEEEQVVRLKYRIDVLANKIISQEARISTLTAENAELRIENKILKSAPPAPPDAEIDVPTREELYTERAALVNRVRELEEKVSAPPDASTHLNEALERQFRDQVQLTKRAEDAVAELVRENENLKSAQRNESGARTADYDKLVERSMGAMQIAEGDEGHEAIPRDCPMLQAVSDLRAKYDALAAPAIPAGQIAAKIQHIVEANYPTGGQWSEWCKSIALKIAAELTVPAGQRADVEEARLESISNPELFDALKAANSFLDHHDCWTAKPSRNQDMARDLAQLLVGYARHLTAQPNRGDGGMDPVAKLDSVLQQDPFRLTIKWDNYQDSGVYIYDGLGRQVGHSPQIGDDEGDSKSETLRAAIASIQLPRE